MRQTSLLARLLLAAALAAGPAAAQTLLRADRAKSDFRIELGRAGLLKALGDDHLIRVNDYDCQVALDEAAPARSSVRLMVRAASLEVLDPHLSAESRAEVQKTMQGPEVLDAGRYMGIRFVSRRVVALGSDRFRVEGDLTIRETTKPATFEVRMMREGPSPPLRVNETHVVTGEARVRLTDFGIRPPSAGAGTVKVKDEMKISFRLILVPMKH